MKRIVSIQDISCVGKCSQAVALPVLSAMGLECAVLPTTLLSAHTAFDGFVSRELTDFFPAVLAHWKALGLRFDAIYTGYLGSVAQVDLVLDFLRDFRTAGVRLLVDPAMADQGVLYSGLSPDLPERMKRLCAEADVVTPNVTEACYLTDTAYRPRHDRDYIRALLEGLLALGARTAVITGVHTEAGRIGVAVLERGGRFYEHQTEFLPCVRYGTGDLFAATCAGAVALGFPPERAAALAADYVAETVRVTAAQPDARWYGVSFESTLPDLISLCRKEDLR